jgi:hypothetical protein
VSESAVAEKVKRDGLKAKRDALYAHYLQNPTNSKLAIEIKLIDDQIAEMVERDDKSKKSRVATERRNSEKDIS